MAAPAWIQRASSAGGGVGDAFTPTMPGGVVSGNLLVMAILTYHPSFLQVDTPSGWTLRASSAGMGFSDDCSAWLFTRLAPASAPNLTGFFANIHCEISEVGGVHATTPVNASASGTPASNPVPTPASTASLADSLAVYLAFENTAGVTYSASPAGTTNRYSEQGSGVSFCQVWADETVGAGSVAADSFTRSGGFNGVALTLVISPAGAPAGPAFVPQIIIVG